MRFFIPLTPDELSLPELPLRAGTGVQADATLTAEQMELLYEAAMAEAAFQSLAILMDNPGLPPCRIVAVAESERAPRAWKLVESFHVDGVEGAELITSARDATTQDELDDVVSDLAEADLEWYDATEADYLRRRFELPE